MRRPSFETGYILIVTGIFTGTFGIGLAIWAIFASHFKFPIGIMVFSLICVICHQAAHFSLLLINIQVALLRKEADPRAIYRLWARNSLMPNGGKQMVENWIISIVGKDYYNLYPDYDKLIELE